jgi:hypothetical protein
MENQPALSTSLNIGQDYVSAKLDTTTEALKVTSEIVTKHGVVLSHMEKFLRDQLAINKIYSEILKSQDKTINNLFYISISLFAFIISIFGYLFFHKH